MEVLFYNDSLICENGHQFQKCCSISFLKNGKIASFEFENVKIHNLIIPSLSIPVDKKLISEHKSKLLVDTQKIYSIMYSILTSLFFEKHQILNSLHKEQKIIEQSFLNVDLEDNSMNDVYNCFGKV